MLDNYLPVLLVSYHSYRQKSIPIMQIGTTIRPTKIHRFVGLVSALFNQFLKAQKAQNFIYVRKNAGEWM